MTQVIDLMKGAYGKEAPLTIKQGKGTQVPWHEH